MRVNKAGKKRHFTFCGPAMGPDSRSQSENRNRWWRTVLTDHSKSKPSKVGVNHLNPSTNWNLPNNPKNYHSGLVKW